MATDQVEYLIIGGGPAGTKAAESIRQDDPGGRILIVTKEPHRLYNRTALPHYVKGIKRREELFMRSEEQYIDQRIGLLSGVEVVKLDTNRKTVETGDGRQILFNKVLISSGGRPHSWSVSGSSTPGVVRLNTLDDADEIIRLLPATQEIVIVGGGFISLELCSIAAHYGKKTTLLVREPYCWANILDEISGNLITQYLKKNRVVVRTDEEVIEVIGDTRVRIVKTAKGEEIPAQMVGVGIGIKRDLDFLKGSPVQVNEGVLVNNFLESSVSGVWAAGDMAEFDDVSLGKRHVLGNWKNASDQGFLVGHNMAGRRQPFEGVSSYGLSVFDFHVAFVGDPKREGAEIIERGDKKTNLGRIFVVDDLIVGATLIARPADRHPLMELIRQKVPVDAKLKTMLADYRQSIAV
jgi:NADPH-dependent 2,4-dienoyl-CoA reductase/sulfur reductase-like enzyme